MTSCLLCGSAETRPYFEKHGYTLLRCPNCRFAFVSAQPERSTLEQHYQWDYFHGNPERFGYLDYAAERSNRVDGFLSKKRYIEGRFPNGGRLLDVGCADGSFLEMFDGRWDKQGVELSRDMVGKLSPPLRSNVFQGFFEDYPESRGPFDVVTFWDVLDHVKSPTQFLSKVQRLLKPGGLVGLITGDMESLFARLMGKHWYIYIPPTHLSYFSRSSISKALAAANLSVEKIVYEGKPVSLQLAFYRMRIIWPWKPWARLMQWFERRTPATLGFPLNLFDIMTVWGVKR